jgi:hypothetical protein
MKKQLQVVIIVAIFLILLIGTPLLVSIIPEQTLEEYGIFLILIPIFFLVIIMIILLLLINLFSGIKKTTASFISKPRTHNEKVSEKIRTSIDYNEFNEDELKQKRDLVKNELNELENRFLKNKITKELFDNTTKEKQEQLIRIETLIDSKRKINLSENEIKKINETSSDKKKVLKGLFEQKLLKAHELNLAEQSYLKRKIDEVTYSKISSNIKKELISIDSQISLINKNEEVNKIKNQLKEGAKEIAKQKKNTKTRNLEEIIQDDVFDQLELMR